MFSDAQFCFWTHGIVTYTSWVLAFKAPTTGVPWIASPGGGGLISVYFPRMEHWDSSIKCVTSKVNVYGKKSVFFF